MQALRVLAAAALAVAACSSDDGDGDGSEAGTTGPATTTAPTSTSAPADTSDDGSNAGSTSTGDPPPPPDTSTGPGDDDTGSSSGDGGTDGVVLQNDSWAPPDTVVWQTWPNTNDCWASVFEAEADHYPFDIVGAEVAIGDAKGMFTFEVGVWEVDNSGMPETVIDNATLAIDGASGDLTDIDFGALGLELPAIDSGEFAIVMCHTEHMGQPSIAIDADGDVAAASNWVYQQAMGEWVQAPDFFGIDGDFILRAVIEPQ